MKRGFLLSAACVLGAMASYGQITLDYCLSKADENYPLIKRYALVERTQAIELSDIDRQWLPSVSAYAQATVQNRVPEFPSALTDIMAAMGHDMRGLGKAQYKVGVDVTQTIWDGGAAKARRDVARNATIEGQASLDVAMYAMHERVMSFFFAALLTSEQMRQQEAAISLLESNLTKIEAMLAGGTAMKSDADNVKAQLLASRQKLTEAAHALSSYRRALEIFIGEGLDGKTLEKPSAAMPADLSSDRPELKLYESQVRANNARVAEIRASVMPRFGFFAQAFYGYPGFNNFESMMNRSLSFNVLAGVRASWSLSPLYTKNNSLHRIALANEAIAAERETFLFNSDIKVAGQNEQIEGLREVTATDREIVALRTDVRKAAESQLDNGVIDTFTLLAKITDETQARLAAAYHEIQLLNAIQQLRYTINR
ncbi:MAG: TolC family protein [Bacteroides sp.]|nr:TolC family protein [Bacteroides sp.]